MITVEQENMQCANCGWPIAAELQYVYMTVSRYSAKYIHCYHCAANYAGLTRYTGDYVHVRTATDRVVGIATI